MKIRLITIAALAAFAAAPYAAVAADKEAQNPQHSKVCIQKKNSQVALFVSGQGVANNGKPVRAESLTGAQVGQGMGVTFFTGNR